MEIRSELVGKVLYISVIFVGIAIAKKNFIPQRTLYQRNKEQKENNMETEVHVVETCGTEEPRILEEIQVEELAIDGICGVY
jgi:mycofactocin precursor